MQMTKKQLEFWTIALIFCIGVSILVLVIDFGIKGAILEESTRLRLIIEEHSGRTAKANADGNVDDVPVHGPDIGPVLVDDAPGLETGSNPNGDKASVPGEETRGTKPSRQARARGIQDGNEQVG